jgi:Uma2 family endonuclease
MSLPKPLRMDADTFLAWSLEQDGRFELIAGRVVEAAAERASHNRVKFEACRTLKDGVRDAGLRCEVYTDGMAVRVDDATVYEPDATLRCGEPLDDEAIEFSDPVVVVEVLSPSTRAIDVGAKLSDYFRLPSVRHYLILRTDSRTAIHHARSEDGMIATTILTAGTIAFDPPGVAIDLAVVFGTDAAGAE